MDYKQFIKSKVRRPKSFGFEPDGLNPNLFEWQSRVVDWACKRGRSAIFAECGLGKTLMQLSWADQVCKHTGGSVLLHCPVGVRAQTKREAVKFEIETPVHICDSQDDSKGIVIANYEKLHKFDSSRFVGVVLDESSILKNFTGTIKRQLIDAWSESNYRLACTATPAPNDYTELATHAEFIGCLSREEMLSRWFVNDTANVGDWRLKGHAQTDFWEWMSSWAVCISKPSDIGGDDSGFKLPRLVEHVHCITEELKSSEGFLFDNFELSATNVHKQKRSTTEQRAEKVAELVDESEPWLVWCDSNYESEALAAKIPHAVEVRGSDNETKKQDALQGFSNGEISCLVTKPKIAGFGMNWQHCNNMAFIGLSYSFEQYYQAVRRCWRFGQKRPVNVHIVETDGESALRQAIVEKRNKFQQMQKSMAVSVSGLQLRSDILQDKYSANRKMEIPTWLNA